MTGPVSVPVPAAVSVPAAVAQSIAALVMGAPHVATIIGVHSAAVIIRYDEPVADHRAPGSEAGVANAALASFGGGSEFGDASVFGDGTVVVTVLAAEGSGVPNGVRTALHAADRPFSHLHVGDTVTIGGGRIEMPKLTLSMARTVRTQVPRVEVPAPVVATIAAAAAQSPRGVADDPVERFRTALMPTVSDAVGKSTQSAQSAQPSTTDSSTTELERAVRALVGLGTGSTPGGDDVLAGTLAGLHATGQLTLAARISAAALSDIDERTPQYSAQLLRLAAAGHVCDEARAVLIAAHHAHTGDEAELAQALRELLKLGHTSGADLTTGLAIGLGLPLRLSHRDDPTAAHPRDPRPASTTRPHTAHPTDPHKQDKYPLTRPAPQLVS